MIDAKEKEIENEIRLNIDDDEYYIIKPPSTFSELTQSIEACDKTIDISKCEISMVFVKYPEMFCQDQKSFEKILAKKDQIFLEIKVKSKKEAVEPDVYVNFSERKPYDFEFVLKQEKFEILKGNNKFNIIIKIKNIGQKDWDLPATLCYFRGEKGVVCTDFPITKKIKPDEMIETNIALYDLNKLELGEHEIKLILKIGSNIQGEPKGLTFTIVDIFN